MDHYLFDESPPQRSEHASVTRRCQYLQREQGRLSSTADDLGRQVTVLLTQLEHARAGLPAPNLGGVFYYYFFKDLCVSNPGSFVKSYNGIVLLPAPNLGGCICYVIQWCYTMLCFLGLFMTNKNDFFFCPQPRWVHLGNYG